MRLALIINASAAAAAATDTHPGTRTQDTEALSTHMCVFNLLKMENSTLLFAYIRETRIFWGGLFLLLDVIFCLQH